MPERPHVLLVPSIAELEWNRVSSLIADWADIASYDHPGLGPDAPAEELTLESTVQRGVDELNRRGWNDAVLVGDQFGSGLAVFVARAWEGTVRGLALGHACLHYRREGPRPAISEAVAAFQLQLTQVGPAAAEQMFVQGLELTYGADVAAGIRERLSPTFTSQYTQLLLEHDDAELGEPLRELDVPLLFVQHRDCPLWTDEGFEDAVAAFPDAKTLATVDNPGSSPEFAEALREFVLSLPEAG